MNAHGNGTEMCVVSQSSEAAMIDCDVHLGPSHGEVAASLCELLHRTIATIDGAVHAGIVVGFSSPDVDREVRAFVNGDDVVRDLATAEYRSDDGPSLSARERGEIVRISSTVDDGPWPEFRAACAEHQIMSTASFPMSIDDVTSAALTVYSDDYHAFDVGAIRAGRLLAAEAAAIIAAAPTSSLSGADPRGSSAGAGRSRPRAT